MCVCVCGGVGGKVRGDLEWPGKGKVTSVVFDHSGWAGASVLWCWVLLAVVPLVGSALRSLVSVRW